MVSNHDHYVSFIASGCTKTITRLQKSVKEHEEQINEYKIIVLFALKVNGQWEEKERVERRAVRPTGQDFASITIMCQKLGLSSPKIESLSDETIATGAENPDAFVLIEKTAKSVFDEILKDGNQIVRVLNLTIIVELDDFKFSEYAHRDYNRNCAHCEKWRTTAHKLSHCLRCMKASYCNRDCQVADWSTHKKICKRRKQAPENSSTESLHV